MSEVTLDNYIANMVDKRSAPAYSIGNSTVTFKQPTHQGPGPGAY